MKAETCEIRTRNKPKCLFKNEETIRERLTVNYLFTISTSGHSIVKLLQNKALVFFTFSFHRPFYSSFFYHIAAIFFSLFSLFSIFFFFFLLVSFFFVSLPEFVLAKVTSCFTLPAFRQAVPHLNIDQICRFLTSVI